MKFIKDLFYFVLFIVVIFLMVELMSWENFALMRNFGFSKQACNSLSYSWKKGKSRLNKFVDIAKKRVEEYLQDTESNQSKESEIQEVDYDKVASNATYPITETINELETSIKDLLSGYVEKDELENKVEKVVKKEDLEVLDRKYVDVLSVTEGRLKQELQNVLRTTESLQVEQKNEIRKEFEELLGKNIKDLESKVNNMFANRINFVMNKFNNQMKSSKKTEKDFDMVLSDTGFKSKFYDFLKKDLRMMEISIKDEMKDRVRLVEKLQDEYKEKVQSQIDVMFKDSVRNLEDKIGNLVNKKLVTLNNQGSGLFSSGRETNPTADFMALLESKLSTTEARLKELVDEKVETLKKKIKKVDKRSKYLGQKMIEQEEELADRLVQDEVARQIDGLRKSGEKKYKSKMKTAKKTNSRKQFLADLIDDGR